MYRAESIHKHIADVIFKQYSLDKFTPEIKQAHIGGDIHLHDLDYGAIRPVCIQHDPRMIFKYGLKVDGTGRHTSVSKPAKNLEVAVQHSAKILATAQCEMSGGQSIDEFNVWLAPYAKGKTYAQIKQAMQMFVYEMTQMYVARGNQCVFSSINVEMGVPDFLKNTPAIMNGMECGTYGDYDEEAKLILEALCDVLLEGDATGKMHLFPNFIVKLRNDAFKNENKEIMNKLNKLVAEYGLPYFINMTAEYQDVNTNSMGCVDYNEVIVYRVNGLVQCESIGRLKQHLIDNDYQIEEYGISQYIDIDGGEYEIYDGKEFVGLKKYIINPNRNNWVKLSLENGREIVVTNDHPFYTKRGKILTKDLQSNDEIPVVYNHEFNEGSIEDVDYAWLFLKRYKEWLIHITKIKCMLKLNINIGVKKVITSM
jgi:hypothetical protein